MTSVLLITDTERVQGIFADLETEGVLQLRTAATMTQGDLEISAAAPQFTFLQSRISGFSGEILLRHMKKALPKGAKIILLAGDADDVAQASQAAMPFVDLTVDDEALADAIREILAGKRRPARKKAAAGQAGPAGKSRGGKLRDPAAPPPVVEEPEMKEEPPAEVEPPAGATVPDIEEPVVWKFAQLPASGVEGTQSAPVQEPPAAQPVQQTQKPAAQGQERTAVLTAPETGKPVADEAAPPAGPESFEEIMRRAAAKGGTPVTGPLDVEDRVYIGKSPLASAEETGTSAGSAEEATGTAPDDFFRGESLADAMLRAEKKKRPKWILPLALALLLIPLVSYLVGRRATPPEPLLTPKGVARPEPRPLAVPAPGTSTAPVPLTQPAPTAKPAPAPGLPPASKAETRAKAGLKTVPPFIVGAKVDAGYGLTHPGWVRYVGTKAEYKLFKESDLYRAIQVIAPGGETISDELFRRALLEFGGVDSYRVESTGKKGDYLLEHGAAKGTVALTIYRTQKGHKIKGFVIYYR